MMLLTDEEIWAELGILLEERHLRVCRSGFNAFKKGNKAQLKKVVEWLKDTSMDAHTTVFQVSTKKWQALLEEIK